MDFRKLEYFVTVADEGSITAAAGRLHMSQPPLSTQLKLLEEELGVRLFERGSRSIRLTDAGKMLYQRARGILDMAADAEREVKDFGDGLQGSLRLGVISSAGSGRFYANIRSFKARYPRVLFEIREGNTYALLELLRQGQIEAALLRTPFVTEGMKCRYLEREAMMAVGAREYFDGILLPGQAAEAGRAEAVRQEDREEAVRQEDWEEIGRREGQEEAERQEGQEEAERQEGWEGAGGGLAEGRVIALKELAGRPLIVYRRWEGIIAGEFHSIGEEPFILCRNDDARTTAAWADAGLGIGILPKPAVDNTSWQPGICRAVIGEEKLYTRMALVTREGKYVSSAARRFVEEFR